MWSILENGGKLDTTVILKGSGTIPTQFTSVLAIVAPSLIKGCVYYELTFLQKRLSLPMSERIDGDLKV